MTAMIDASFDVGDESVLMQYSFFKTHQNVLDYTDIYEPHSMARALYSGALRMASDGLQGVIADGIPTSATVVLIQEHQGHFIEVGRMVTSDGSWNISGLQDKPTHAIALKPGFNAGITAYITPED